MAEYRYPLGDEIRKLAENAINEAFKNKFVPVVRCKDCRHKVGEYDGYICCDKNIWREPDWYCADGERVEE